MDCFSSNQFFWKVDPSWAVQVLPKAANSTDRSVRLLSPKCSVLLLVFAIQLLLDEALGQRWNSFILHFIVNLSERFNDIIAN